MDFLKLEVDTYFKCVTRVNIPHGKHMISSAVVQQKICLVQLWSQSDSTARLKRALL